MVDKANIEIVLRVQTKATVKTNWRTKLRAAIADAQDNGTPEVDTDG